MANKTKFDYEIEQFTTHFSKFKDKKIVLYGTGRMTATLVNGANTFQFIGLCDRDEGLIGTQMYGLPILPREQAEKQADLLVINTSETYWSTIYQRIKEWDIPIYYLNGKQVFDLKEDSYDENPYWNQSYQQLKEKAFRYDIISFDIFDTVVMRKVMFPIDVFRIIESKLQLKEEEQVDFIAVRKKASSLLNEPTLDEIYEKIAELTRKRIDEVAKWKEVEIVTDQQLLTPRTDMVSLCKELMNEKQVYFVSDMYYSTEILIDILQNAGLNVQPKQIIVSCELKKTKESGELWDYYKANILADKVGLHIGDNGKSDERAAKEHGIDAYKIMSSFELLQNSSMKRIVPYIESLYSSVSMGLISSKILNSPFALNQLKGKIVFENETKAGYCLLGCLMDTFMRWMICKAEKHHVNQLVFFAREGYLLIPLYNYMKKLLGNQNAPIAIYLEISRRAVWGAFIKQKKDIYEVAKFPYNGRLKEFLNDRFGVEVQINEAQNILISEVQGDVKLLEYTLNPYEEMILTQSKKEKNSYNRYIEELGLQEEMAIVDSQFYGSTQYYFGKILNKALKGYYFCACIDDTNSYLTMNQMFGCFQGEHAMNTNVHKQAQFLEAYFTSPNGMLEYIAVSGEKKYAHKMSNQKNFDVRLDMNEGIKHFMKEINDILHGNYFEYNSLDTDWADILFGVFMNQGFRPTQGMKQSFYFDNKVCNNREMPIWE